MKPYLVTNSILTCLRTFGFLCGLMFVAEPVDAQFQQHNPVEMWVLRGQTQDQFSQQMISRGVREIGMIKRTLTDGNVPLTDKQEARLNLAVEGTAAEFGHDLSIIRASTQDLDMNNAQDQQKALQMLQPVMMRAQSSFYGKGSMFYQVVKRTLDQPQLELLTAEQQATAKRRAHVLNQRFVAALDERIILLKVQREKLVELMDKQQLKEIPANLSSIEGYLRIIKIPDKELGECLDAEQVKTLQQLIAPYRNFEANLP